MGKMNYYACNKNLAERLTSFINDKKVDFGSIQYFYDFQIKQIMDMIAAQNNLRGSIFKDEEIDTKISELESQAESIRIKKQEELDKLTAWEYNENDKKLDKLSKKKDVTDLELAIGIVEWFSFYGYKVDDMQYVYNLVYTCFGVKEKTDKAFVKDILKGKDADATMRRTDSLKTFYAQISTDAMIAGTVKVKNLSEVVRETYEKELAEKKATKKKSESVDYTKLSRKELQAECKKRGLRADGKKDDMIERLTK